MSYRVVIPSQLIKPFEQPATSASDALTKLRASQSLFGDDAAFVETTEGVRISAVELVLLREAERAADQGTTLVPDGVGISPSAGVNPDATRRGPGNAS